MELYSEKKPVPQGCHDLHMTDGESVLKRTAIVMWCIQLRQESD